MKKSYKRLVLFQCVMFAILILNSFISNILSEYNIIIFSVAMLVLFKFLLGFEKDRNRFVKDVIFEVSMFLIFFLLAYYFLGIFIGFARTSNYYTFGGFKTFIIPIALSIPLKECLRYMMLKKSEGKKFLIFITVLLFIFLDVSDPIYYNKFADSYESFIFVALTLLPAISTNILCTYISINSGYKPTILYLLVMELYQYLVPIVPNPNEYLSSIIQFIVPFILLYKLHGYFQKEKDEYTPRDYSKKDYLILALPAFVIIVLVYFTSGYFKYQAVAIATGSMVPTINKGDVVIIEKFDNNVDKLKEGQIIAFEYHGVLIVHRIIRISEVKGEYFLYTQGDANNAEDGYPVTQDMIVGTISVKIPYIGLPTVWLKEV